MKKGIGMLMKRFGLVSVIAVVLGMILIGLSGIAPDVALSWPGDPTPDEIVVRTPAAPPEIPTVTPVLSGGPSPSTSEVIVDDEDSGFQPYGPSGGWQHSGSGDTTYNGHAYWTYCTDTWEGSSVNNWAIWTPNLPESCEWEVLAYIPWVDTGRYDTGRARYQIHTASGDYVVERDQDSNTGWVSLGTYTFNAGTSGYVRLEDVTPDWYFIYGGQRYRKTIKFDAIKWTTAGPPTGGLTLYEHTYYSGRSETFSSDDPNLNDNWIGNDTASSLILSSDYVATLYEHTYYGGRSETFTGPINDLDLSDNWIGNDTVSSLRVSRGPSPVSVDIWVDRGEGAVYYVGDPIHVCYSVSRPIYVKIYDCPPGQSCYVMLEGYDDGTGGCIYGTIIPPTGWETVRIEAIENSQVVAEDETYFFVTDEVETEPPPGYCRVRWVDAISNYCSGEFGLYSPQQIMLFSDYVRRPSPDVVQFGHFNPGTSLVFYIRPWGFCGPAEYLSTSANAHITELGTNRWRIAWEDLPPDRADDYNDLIVEVECGIDNEAPSIYNVVESNDPICKQGTGSPDTVNISAQVTDSSGVAWAKLYYRLNYGSWNNVTMSHSDGTYSATIGPFSETGTVEYYIKARDNVGNEGNSSTNTVTVQDCDITPPYIFNVVESNDPICKQGTGSPDTVTISAQVTDPSGVAWAKLYYRLNYGSWSNVTMGHSGSTYSATIGPFSEAGTVEYYIKARDNADNEGDSSTNTVTVQDCSAPDARVSVSLSLSKTSAAPGEDVTASFTIHNYGNASFGAQLLGVGGRGPGGEGDIQDFPFEGPVIVLQGRDWTYTGTRSFSTPGQYHFGVVYQDDYGHWHDIPANPGVSRETVLQIVDNQGPSITNIEESDASINIAECPEPNEVTISSRVTDASGVNWVNLVYWIDAGDHYEVSMTKGFIDAYRATIGPFSQAGTLYYYVMAQDNAGNEDQSYTYSVTVNDCDVRQRLANRFAPALSLHSGEIYEPEEVGIMVGQAALRKWCPKDWPKHQTVRSHLTIPLLSTYGSPLSCSSGLYYMDIPGNPHDPTVYENDYGSISDAYDMVTYARVVDKDDPDNPPGTTIQYWFFYYYNPGPERGPGGLLTNRHEGDWEQITLVFDDSIADILANADERPIQARYSAHGGGVTRQWDELQKVDQTHPVVFVARGAHASYPYRCNTLNSVNRFDVCEDQPKVRPTVVVIPDTPGSEWLNYVGKWGEYSEDGLFDDGPDSISGRDKYRYPYCWGMDLGIPCSAQRQQMALNKTKQLAFDNALAVQTELNLPLEVRDSEGRRLTTGVFEIPDALFFDYGSRDGKLAIIANPNLSQPYTIWLDGATVHSTTDLPVSVSTASEELTIAFPESEHTVRMLQYRQVTLSSSASQAKVQLQSGGNFLLLIDQDGDGHFETQQSPDVDQREVHGYKLYLPLVLKNW